VYEQEDYPFLKHRL